MKYGIGMALEFKAQLCFYISLVQRIISISNGKIQALAKGQTSFKASLNGIDSNEVSVTVIDKFDSSKIVKDKANHKFNANGRVTKVIDEEGGWKNYNKNGNNYIIETAAGNRSQIVMDGINKQSTSFSGLQRNVSYSDNGMTKTVQTCGIKSLTHYTLDQKTGDEVIKDQTLTLPTGKTLTTSIERVYAFNEDKTTKTLSINTTSNANTAVVNTDYTQGLTTTTSAMGRITKSYFDTNTLLPINQANTRKITTALDYSPA